MSPRFAAFWESSRPVRAVADRMRHRQLLINEAMDDLKTLMTVPDHHLWDIAAIKSAMRRMSLLFRAQEADGRDILAAAVAFGVDP